MTRDQVFSPRLLVGWIAAAVVVFAASGYFMIRGDSKTEGSDAIGPSTFSRSAIGYAGIADVLTRFGMPVVKSQSASLEKLGTGGVLVVAEPRFSLKSEETIRGLVTAKTVVLVLPKWQGFPSKKRPAWLRNHELKPPGDESIREGPATP